MTARLKRRSLIFGAGVLVYLCALVVSAQVTLSDWVRFVWFLIAYLIVGFDSFVGLRDRFARKRFLTEYTLMILATVGAFGIERYEEGVLVMILFELGLIFEAFSTDTAKRSIAEMIDIRPQYAIRKVKGKEQQVDPSELKRNHIIIIKPGERIPVDAVITSGTTTIDTKAVTGESVPVSAGPGDRIYSGCINLRGVVEARVSKVYKESTVSKIMEMVEEAQNQKAESETIISRFASIYTPVMLVIALLVMVYPPLTFSYGNWETWIYRGLIFLIVACPSGLVMSVPIAFLGGIAAAARQGIVVKGGNYLEDMSKADTFIFDKTGTLTKGVFKVKEIHPEGMPEEELLKIAAHVESYSNHPIAHSLLEAYTGRGRTVDKEKVYRMKEIPGFGITATYAGQRIHVGNWRMMRKQKVEAQEVVKAGTVVYVAVDRRYAGYILIADEIKEDARWTLRYLKEKCRGVLVMLTGDSEAAGREVAEELGMDYAYTNLLPKDKLEQVEDFLLMEDSTEKVVCIGDGINDAPILTRADVGIAMGDLGSAAAVEAADVILMEDELGKITNVIQIAKETLRVVGQNLSFALVIKAIVLVLAVIGYFGMWEAILAEVGVMFTVILNAVWVVKYTA
ncbi:MAG TPA: cadmium-translocating P-type ATPase [Candidatus Dorea gallistercoris]|uniref:Cd(2+)-exporting ATPase n=1 Tax=Candidatus Dorea gallistercoris TaxID=2838542 RepID=A0A9D1RC58_9FIRM|nr:cadmium-translocating P-type ATPase [Candidatus Dorea gallistercoris]